ncbi:MAG: DUF1348 family protein [Pirellulales bacterium]
MSQHVHPVVVIRHRSVELASGGPGFAPFSLPEVANHILNKKLRCGRCRWAPGDEKFREYLTRKSERELDYRLTKSLWSFTDNRIAVRFQYEYHDAAGRWFRAYGNELWEFDEDGLMRRREASINDVSIQESERKFRWPAPGPRPADDTGIPAVR